MAYAVDSIHPHSVFKWSQTAQRIDRGLDGIVTDAVQIGLIDIGVKRRFQYVDEDC